MKQAILVVYVHLNALNHHNKVPGPSTNQDQEQEEKDKVVQTEEQPQPQPKPESGDNEDATTYWDIQ